MGGTAITNDDGGAQHIIAMTLPIYKQRFDVATVPYWDDEVSSLLVIS